MIARSLMNLDQLDPPKSPLRKGALNGSTSPFFLALAARSVGARGNQISHKLLSTPSRVKGVGIDIVSIPRMAQLIKRYDRQTLTLLFTIGEIDQCQAAADCDRAFAVCFATKEAVGKALGTGLVDIEWNEIETIFSSDCSTSNQFTIELSGAASIKAKQREIQTWLATWHEWDEHILVHVLAL